MSEASNTPKRDLGAKLRSTASDNEMESLVEEFDWSQTPIGAPNTWSPTLRTMVRFLLANRFPMLLWWGPQYISIYNDAYRPVLATKHPWALGKPVSECWSEIWDVLEPLIDTPFNGGPATWNEDIELEINRHGFLEETHFTIAYSPVPDEAASNGIGGVLATVTEITEKVVGERRTVILRDLASRASDARGVDEACAIAAEILERHARDIPFALLYMTDPDRRMARLVAMAGAQSDWPFCPPTVCLTDEGAIGRWDFPSGNEHVVVDDLSLSFPTTEERLFSRLSRKAVIMPISGPGVREPVGFIIVGANPHLRLDERYLDFLQLMTAQVANAIANARSYEEERKRSEALAELDRAKTMFFSNVSHEFRTPLSLMLGHLDDVISNRDLPSSDRESLAIAHRNSLRLLKLVNTLLEFSRIEAGRAEAVFELTDLASMTAGLASLFRSATEKAGLKLLVKTTRLGECAHVDRQMWEKIVLNLLSNAFKYTLEGEIEVKLEEDERNFILKVRDTGIGIPPEEMPRLFERFHRVEGAAGRSQEGSGIGLAFVQELVKLHGGSVTAESEFGKGSTFRVFIPKGNNHDRSPGAKATEDHAGTTIAASPFIQEALRWLPDAGDEGIDLPEVDVSDHRVDIKPDSRPFVLIVDDNADMRDYLRRLLLPYYEVVTVRDGMTALESIARRQPDLVLSDIMLPGSDGLELLKELRTRLSANPIPIILLSARAGEESRIEGLAAGADDYMIKPFSARELLARIEAQIKMFHFRTMATETLKASEERFRAFVTASSDVVYRMSPDWREMRYLQGKDFIADTDNPSESWLQRYIHPDDQEMITTAVTIAIANKTVFELEHRVIRVDGSLGWTHSRAIPILDGNGEIVEWFGAAHDVSDRKQSEQTQQLLLNELNHRVKNTLASVHAIAQQTLRTSPDPSAFATGFSGRLQALSRVHTLLTSSNWEGAELHAIVRDQLSIGATGDDRITVIGPPARLNPQASQHMAMILHELGTNSLKYGALSNATGLVSLGWSLRDARLHLDWREKAGPPIKTPLGRGFGTRFIETVAKGEGGTAMMSIEDRGLNWEIVLPLASANASFASSSSSPADRAHPETATQIQLPTISGKTFAIIEDEPLIAFNIASILEQEGARVAGPALSVTDALRLIEVSELDGALLDANLRGDGVGDVAAALIRRNIPFAFVTGYGREALPAKFASARLLTKPFTEQQLLKTAIEIVDQDDSVLRYRASGRE